MSLYNHLDLNLDTWTNRTLAVHERIDSRFLVLPGSECTITVFTEYIYFKACREFLNIKVRKISVRILLLD